PTLREYSELTDESRQVMSARLGIELDETARAASDAPDAGDDDGGDSGGGSDGGGSSNGSSSNGFYPGVGYDPGDVPTSNGVGIGASADVHDAAADSELSSEDDGVAA